MCKHTVKELLDQGNRGPGEREREGDRSVGQSWAKVQKQVICHNRARAKREAFIASVVVKRMPRCCYWLKL